MKTIIVPTDFSENADNAANTALILSEKLHTNVLLYNSYISYPTVASYAGGPWLVDEFITRKNASMEKITWVAEKLDILSEQLDPGDEKPAIDWESSDNDLWLGIEDIARRKKIEMIVMGARSGNETSTLFGHDISSVIEHAACPVLIVPAKTSPKQLHKIIFATDFEEADIHAIDYLVKLAKLFNYEIEIVHIVNPGQKDGEKSDKQMKFIQHVSHLKFPCIIYKEVGGKDVARRLSQLARQDGTSLLAMAHHQHSFWARLFVHSETRAELSNQKVPLLIFPA